ncbi:MAG: DUF362 domain-containing protein [Dehalococcoidales bacterium]|nr:DUF362 domain-containing protein [Dehalococcoidales bacterium]
MKPKVAFTAGDSRYENIGKALDLLKDDIDLTGKKDVFIKVNFVDLENEVAVTHVDGVRALLEFLRERYTGKISIGESTERESAMYGFRHFGYLDVLKEHNVNIVDLREDEWEILHLYNSEFQPMDIHYSKTMLECDYLISIGPPKTHDSATVTMSIKNITMGAVSHPHDDKHKIHQGPPVMNLDLYLMAIEHLPELAIIDGMVGMEGNGPVAGDPVDWGIAIASRDAVAADSLGSSLMGFPPETVGYLYYLAQKGYGVGDLEQMEIVGDNPDKYRKHFKPHPWYDWQQKWADEQVNKIIGL